MNEWNSWWASQWRICSYISGPGRLVTGGWCCGAWLPEALPTSLSPEKSGKFSELGPLLSGTAPVQNASAWSWRCDSVVEGLLGMHQGLVTWFGVGTLACVWPWIPYWATQPLKMQEDLMNQKCWVENYQSWFDFTPLWNNLGSKKGQNYKTLQKKKKKPFFYLSLGLYGCHWVCFYPFWSLLLKNAGC